MSQIELKLLETLAELFEAKAKNYADTAMNRRGYAEDEKKECETDEARDGIEHGIGVEDGKGAGFAAAAVKLRAALAVMGESGET